MKRASATALLLVADDEPVRAAILLAGVGRL
jgi:hypothetical protein